jgi:hypothetical protein
MTDSGSAGQLIASPADRTRQNLAIVAVYRLARRLVAQQTTPAASGSIGPRSMLIPAVSQTVSLANICQ